MIKVAHWTESLRLLEEMRSRGLVPDEITELGKSRGEADY